MADTNHMDRMKGWIDSFADDVAVLQRIVEDPDVPAESRILLAAALNYLVTRLDLIPDSEETSGIIDDAMVMRVAMALASERDLGDVDAQVLRSAGRLANEAEVVAEFLGGEMYPRFKRYVQGLTGTVVRGRGPKTIVDDARARGDLWHDIGDELKRLPPAPIKDADQVARTVRNYLTSKLK